MGAEAEVFPDWKEADWRKAAEAALKGASLDKLVTAPPTDSASSLSISRDGPRALTRRRAVARDRPPRPSRRARSQCAGARGSRWRRRRSAGRFAGAIGAYGFGLKRSDPETLAAAFDGVQFDAGTRSNSTSAERPGRGARIRRPYPAARCRAGDQRRVVRPRSLRRGGASDPFPPIGRLTSSRMSTAAFELKAGGFDGPFLLADARSVHARRRPASRSSPSRSARASVCCARLATLASPPRSPRHDRLPARFRRRGIHPARQVPRVARRLGAGRGGLRACARAASSRPRAPGG